MDADVAVFDLGGRRVATLHHGPLAAGPHALLWRGERADGSRAHAGVYFVRAQLGARKLVRKVIRLR